MTYPDRDQIISFAYGNAKLSNPEITKEDIEKAFESVYQSPEFDKLSKLEAQIQEATRLIADFANNANSAHDLIAKLQADLDESWRREAILLNAISRIKSCTNELHSSTTDYIIGIAQKAWDESAPKNEAPTEAGASV